MRCELCEQVVKSIKGLACHIGKCHGFVDSEDYYISFLMFKGEDDCLNSKCTKKIIFSNLAIGYKNKSGERKYCSISCARGNDAVQNKQKKTCLEKYGNANYKNLNKYKETCLEKYGTVNTLSKGTEFYENRNKTVLERYGVENVFQHKDVIAKIKSTNEQSGYWLDFSNVDYSTCKEFYKLAWAYFRRIRASYLSTWDGYDYYDNEFIQANLNLTQKDANYPTVDHKICIRDCFFLGKTPEEASSFNNLCVTKKGLNSIKKCQIEEEFKEWLSCRSQELLSLIV